MYNSHENRNQQQVQRRLGALSLFIKMASAQAKPGPPTTFKPFFAWCQKHLRKGVRLNEEATRYLKTWALITYGSTSTTCDAIKRLLDALPLGRINKARLMETAAQGDDAGETEWVLPTGVDLSGRPTYQIRTILDERRINGRVVFLTSWEPTYEPAENLPSNEIKKFRKRKRKQVERAYIEAEAHEE
jgi:hypothetical protein